MRAFASAQVVSQCGKVGTVIEVVSIPVDSPKLDIAGNVAPCDYQQIASVMTSGGDIWKFDVFDLEVKKFDVALASHFPSIHSWIDDVVAGIFSDQSVDDALSIICCFAQFENTKEVTAYTGMLVMCEFASSGEFAQVENFLQPIKGKELEIFFSYVKRSVLSYKGVPSENIGKKLFAVFVEFGRDLMAINQGE